MPPSDFATADIDKVLNELTTEDAILLTSGVGMWYTHPVEHSFPTRRSSDLE